MEKTTNSEITPIANLKNIIEQKSLKWIFVGGKGGVGKTTVSSSLSIELAKTREKVLIISTDPAHSLSDAFNQKLGSSPTQIKNMNNLFGLEIDPKEQKEDDISMDEVLGVSLDNDSKAIFENVKSSIPGIDEALSIGIILQIVEKMNFSTVVFDTAPTGHTLRMLSFPSVLDQAISHIGQLTNTAGGGILNNPLIQNLGGITNMIEMMKMFKKSIEDLKKQFMDKQHTTFIAVCIPEFLSMYETERLMQELQKMQIDCHNIVINQVLFPDKNCICDMCSSRFEMQKKYIYQIKEIYSDDLGLEDEIDNKESEIKISILPFMENEIRGVNDLSRFLSLLIKG